MENRNCKNCGRFYINNQSCYQKCGEDFTLWQPIPTPNKMIEVNARIKDQETNLVHHEIVTITDLTQPAVQSYVEQEIKSRDLIPLKDAVEYVEIDEKRIETCLTLLNIDAVVRRMITDDLITYNPIKPKAEKDNNNAD